MLFKKSTWWWLFHWVICLWTQFTEDRVNVGRSCFLWRILHFDMDTQIQNICSSCHVCTAYSLHIPFLLNITLCRARQVFYLFNYEIRWHAEVFHSDIEKTQTCLLSARWLLHILSVPATKRSVTSSGQPYYCSASIWQGKQAKTKEISWLPPP